MRTPALPRPRTVPRPRRAYLLLVLPLVALSACGREPSRFDEAQEKTRRNAKAVSKEAMPGAEFNKFFPKAEGAYDVVYADEKAGFAQAKLVKEGQDVATLSIFDTVSNPEAADKYKDTQEVLEGYPAIEIGNSGTGLLVGDRFQVQIRSADANFSKFDREDWLKKFDLANLAKLQ
jgi:hypothetical protein